MVQAWGSLCTKAELDSLIYQFDPSMFERPRNILGVGLPAESSNGQLVSSTMHTLTQVLAHETCQHSQFLFPFNNSLTLIPIRDPSQKNSIVVKCTIFKNWEVNTNGSIEVYSSHRDDPHQEIIRHRISLKNHEICLIERTTKRELAKVKLNHNIDKNGIALALKVMDKKMRVTVNQV